MLKILVCISGGGTNLQAVIDKIASGEIPDTTIVEVISNNRNAYALERARKSGIEAVCISPKDFGDREAFNKALLDEALRKEPDLIVLAGFLVTVPPEMVAAFHGRIINIHPSLIPSFCGVGFYGIKVHEAALRKGVKVTGATVHFVDEGMDTGPIILQKSVEVKQDDTPQTLQRRVMEEAEWKILPLAIELIARNRLKVEEGRVNILD